MAKLEILENKGISSNHHNGAYRQTILFQIKDSNKKTHNFKISINSESYEVQSYANLMKWTEDKGFAAIISNNPKRDYNIDVSYKPQVSPKVFQPIIDDLTKLAKKFVK